LEASFRTQLTVDGDVFPDQIANIYAAGKQNRVAAIVGSNADEMTSLSNPAMNPKTLDKVTEVMTERYGAPVFEKFKEIYRVTDDTTAARAFLHIGGDRAFALGMRQWARFNDDAGLDSYLYYFTHSPPGPGSEYLRAHHAAEIAYAFDNTISSDRRPYSEVDQKLADQIADYWVNFARTGNPNGDGLPNWPEYDPDTEGYIELDDSIEAKQNLLKNRLDFLEAAAAGS
jgi:para-nitrobenzyl esterase